MNLGVHFSPRQLTVVFATGLSAALLCGAIRVRDQHVAAARRAEPTTIYIETRWDGPARLWALNADGSDSVPLPDGVYGEPSWALHNGQRWFLDVREVLGEAYPNGRARRELCAIRADGMVVPLTAQPDLEPAPRLPRWLPQTDDRQVSWTARRWDATGRIVEGGLYVAALLYDADENVVGLAQQPWTPRWRLPLVWASQPEPWGTLPTPDIRSHDWSPDASAVTYDTTRGELWIMNMSAGTAVRLSPTPVYNPVWSPDGRRIAFLLAGGQGAIATICPDGADFAVLATPPSGALATVSLPIWSATGEQLLLRYVGAWKNDVGAPLDVDVCCIERAGGGMRNLTASSTDFAAPVAWRTTGLGTADRWRRPSRR